MEIEALKYPIGKFTYPLTIQPGERAASIDFVSGFPGMIRSTVQSLSDAQLDTPYRPEGWTIRQVVNHLADSHMNAFVRFKLALTEEQPTIKPYMEALWAELPDGKTVPLDASLLILEGVHQRWTVLLRNMSEADFARTYLHPQTGRIVRLDVAVTMYAWHSAHHLRHITSLKERQMWL